MAIIASALNGSTSRMRLLSSVNMLPGPTFQTKQPIGCSSQTANGRQVVT